MFKFPSLFKRQSTKTKPVMIEALEGRTLMSATDPTTPTLLTHITKSVAYHGSLFDGTPFTLRVHAGVADAYDVDNRLQLVIGAGAHASVTVEGDFMLANVTITGQIAAFRAPHATLAGVMSINGSAGTVQLNSITGTIVDSGALHTLQVGNITGTVAVAGAITNINVGSLTSATILSGANLGADQMIGGGDDVYTAGYIDSLHATGPVTSSFVGVGVAPGPDGVFGTSDDLSAGGGELRSLYLAFGSDSSTHFEAGSFTRVRMPGRILQPLLDPRFRAI